MSTSNRWSLTRRAVGVVVAGMLLAGPAMAAATATDQATTPAQWHSQKVQFAWSGFTAFYTCEGLESKVRFILLTFGARNDAKVRAQGCDRAQNKPNKIAWIEAEFSTLTPAADTSAGDTVQGVWNKVVLAPNRPNEMGMGECELVEQMRPMLEKSFSLRNTDYRTTCVPKQISVGDYHVQTDVLQLQPLTH